MPPRRSTSRATAASRRQQPLSFSGSRIKKPLAVPTTADKKLAKKEIELQEPTTADLAIADQVETELETSTSGNVKVEHVLGGRAAEDGTGAVEGPVGAGWIADEEKQARKVAQKQIDEYWQTKERERLAPRVHQKDLSLSEKILREWDMSGQYGPCIGIARLKRWKRANMLGLNPPIEVLAVLLKGLDSAGGAKMQRAYVDELLSSRYIET